MDTGRYGFEDAVNTCSRCGNTFTERDGNHMIDGIKTYSLVGGAYRDSKPYGLCQECAAALQGWMAGKEGSLPRVWDAELSADKVSTSGRVRTDLPVAVFADACGMTRDHSRYNMMREDPPVARISRAAGRTVQGLNVSATVYAATDEVTFLFTDCGLLLRSLGLADGVYEDYVISTFLRYFMREVEKEYPGAWFKCCLFYIRAGDIRAYVQSRREVCHKVAAMYCAKEFLPPEAYRGKEPGEVRKALEESGLWGSVEGNDCLYNGILAEYGPWTPLQYFKGLEGMLAGLDGAPGAKGPGEGPEGGREA